MHPVKDKEKILKLKQFEGHRIRLIHMGEDDPHPVEDGAEGTVDWVDSIGTIHVNWDNGRGLGLVPGIDLYEFIS